MKTGQERWAEFVTKTAFGGKGMKIATAEDVKNILALTDDQIEELQKQQLKIFRSRARLTPEEIKIGRAVELERHHRISGNKDALAEALAQQGRFREAAHTAVREDLKKVLTEKAAAAESPDDDCNCPTFMEEDGLRIPNQYIQSYEIRDGKSVTGIRCKICNTLNIRPILPHLAELKAVRDAATDTKQVRADTYFRR